MQGNETDNAVFENLPPKAILKAPRRPAGGGDARHSQWAFVGRVLGLTALLMLVVSKAQAQNFTYAYDELGRLIAVVDPIRQRRGLQLRCGGESADHHQHHRRQGFHFHLHAQQRTGGLTSHYLWRRVQHTPSQNTVTLTARPPRRLHPPSRP